MKSLGIISLGFEATDQLLIRSFAFVKYWRRNGSTMRQYISYSQTTRKPMIQLEGKQHTILSIKLVRLIKMCLNETYSKVCIGKYLSDSFHIQNGLKHGDALSPLLFNNALEQRGPTFSYPRANEIFVYESEGQRH
jgi:hypothetical protein